MEKFEIEGHFDLESSTKSGILTMNKYIRKNKEEWINMLEKIKKSGQKS